MKSMSFHPGAALRRATSFLPMRYRCVALLLTTLFLFPVILLAMGLGALLQEMPRAGSAIGRLCIRRTRFSRDEARLAEVPAAVTFTTLQT
jgi:hypothetical protein